MKQNWDIYRNILLEIEKSPTPRAAVRFDRIPGLNPQEVGYHMQHLYDAGLIGLKIDYSRGGDGRILLAVATGMKMDGHRMLDTLRDGTLLKRAQTHIRAVGGVITLASVGKAVETITASLMGG